MDEAETTAKPVLVPKRRRVKRAASEANVTPTATESQSESPPAEQKPVLTGEPDHSLVPTPPKRLLEPAEFFRFWKSIPERERNAWFIAYPYRKLPVCDVLQPLSEEEMRLIASKKRKAPETNCGKLAEPFNPDNWERDVYEWKGAGDYHIRLNDTHPSVKGTVCETSIRGLRDWDNFPPILNENEVVLDEPLNQPYLRWARLRGIKFPGDPGAEIPQTPFDNEEDMANVAAVEKLTDALVDATRNRPQPVPITAPTPPDRSNEILADAALKGQQILLDSIKAQGKAQDPMEFHKAVTEAAKAMVPAPAPSGGNSELLTMMQTMMKQQADTAAIMLKQQQDTTALMVGQLEKRLEAAERRAEAADARAQAATHPPAAATPEFSNPVKNMLDLMKGFAAIKNGAADLIGTADPTDGMSPWERIATKVLDAAPNMLHNIAVMQSGHGTPAPPPDLNTEIVEAENQPPAVEAAQQPEAAKEEEVFSKARIAQEIAAPLIDALNKQHKGFQFAAGMILTPKIMGFPGRVVYEMAIEEGQDGMLAILQSYPPLWEKLIKIPRQLQQFIVEFFDSPTAYQIARSSQQQAQQPAPPQQAITPEELPAEQPKGRTVIGADGKPISTVGKKGPVVNGPAVQAGTQ